MGNISLKKKNLSGPPQRCKYGIFFWPEISLISQFMVDVLAHGVIVESEAQKYILPF